MSKMLTICMHCHKVFKIMSINDGKDREIHSHGYCTVKCMEEQMKELDEQEEKAEVIGHGI